MASKMLEARTVAAVDPGGMRDIIASLPEQLSTGMKVGEAAPVPLEEAQRNFVVGMGGPGPRARGSHRASASPPDPTPPGERCPIEPGEGPGAPNPGRGPHHVRGPAFHRGRPAMANPTERELEGPRVYFHVPRSGP